MKIKCIHCRQDVILGHKIFRDYDGPVKCFCCGSLIKVRIEKGSFCSAYLMNAFPRKYFNIPIESSFHA